MPIGEYNKATNPGGMLKPYVLVYEASSLSNYTRYGNGEMDIKIVVAFPTSYQEALNDYVLFELVELLDKKVLKVWHKDNVSRVQVTVTDRMSRIVTATSDGYIARERTITVPYKWR